MFTNIGKKIKGLAKFICWVGIIFSVIGGILQIVNGVKEATANGVSPVGQIVLGVIIIVGGFLISWIGSFFMYGFGELIDKTADIAENTKK